MKKRLSILIIVFVSAFVLAEIFLRVFAHQRLTLWERGPIYADKITGYRYTPNQLGVVRNVAFSNNYQANQLGFLSEEFDLDKPLDVFRVIIIGSSEEAGIDTNGPNNYVNLLRNYFRDKKVEIMNWSIDGLDRSKKNIDLLRSTCINYKPDLVLMRGDFPVSDNVDFRTSYKGHVIWYYKFGESLADTKKYIDETLIAFSFKNFLLQNFYTVRLVGKYCLDNSSNFSKSLFSTFFNNDRLYLEGYMRKKVLAIGSKSPSTLFFSAKESMSLYIDLKKDLEEINCNLVFFNTYFEGNNFKNYLFSKNDIEFLALDIDRKPEHSFGKLDGHSNQVGHKLIADTFYQKLYDSKLIPVKYFNDLPIKNRNLVKEQNVSSIKDFNLLKLSSKNLFIDETDFEIAYISNDKTDEKYINITNKMLSRHSNTKITPYYIEKSNSTNIFDFVEKFDSLFSKKIPNIILLKFPEDLLNSSSVKEFYDFTFNYNSYLNDKKSKLAFLNIPNSQNNLILKYISSVSGLDHITLKREYPDWFISIEGEENIIYSDHKLNANYLYNELVENYIPDDHLNPIKNLALNKEVSVSSDYNSWGWEKAFLTDGVIYTWRFSRGWVSDFENISETDKSWAVINLKEKSYIKNVKIHPFNSYGKGGEGFPNNFLISISEDGENWDKIHEEKNYNPKDKEAPYFLTIDHKATFFKIETVGVAGKFIGFTEIEVFGTEL